MIAHIAESCFWLFRYLERVETTSRIIHINNIYTLDGEEFTQSQWRPIIQMNGQVKVYESIYDKKSYNNDAQASQFLTWEEMNPESIYNAFTHARENARTIRDTISSEFWNALNGFWLWLELGEGKELYNKNKYIFLEKIRDHCNSFRGIYYCSMRQEEAFEFLHIGMMLERALQTARILLLTLFSNKPPTKLVEGNNRYWLAVLNYCAANESFLKCPHYDLKGQSVAEFLVFEQSFPRAIFYCIKQALISFSKIRNYLNIERYTKTEIELSTLMDKLAHGSKVEYITGNLNKHLLELIKSIEYICIQTQIDFFYKEFDDLY